MVRRLAGALARHAGQEGRDILRCQWGQRDNAAIPGYRIPTFPGMAIDISETKHLSDTYKLFDFGYTATLQPNHILWCFWNKYPNNRQASKGLRLSETFSA